MRTKQKTTAVRRKKTERKGFPWQLILLALAIPLTVILTQFPQTLRSSAQSILESPPLFYCLAVGESNKDLCASSTLEANTTLQLNGFEFSRDKIVYYNDTLTGEATYTNTGDVPVTIKKIALVAESKNTDKRVEFNPNRQNVIVQPGKTVTVSASSRMFTSPDPSGTWEVFSSVTMNDGKRFDNPKKTIINVSSSCTALRALPLNDEEIGNLKVLCTRTPESKLCTSRQYCELIGGERCKQNAPAQEHQDKQLQCDGNVIIPKEEQEFLEEYCEEYSDSSTCTDYCARTIDSAICEDGFTIDENADSLVSTTNRSRVAGVSTIAAIGNTNCRPGQQTNKNTGECCKYQGPNLPNGQCPRAPGAAAPAPAAPAPGGGGGACKNAVGRCNSGCMNTSGQCCKNNGPLRSTGQCPTSGGGSAPAAPAHGGGGNSGGGGGTATCASGTRNSVGQCCRYSGALTAGGRCPRAAGGGGSAPAPRVERTPGGEVRRTCAAGKVVRNGRCVSVDGSTPNTPGSSCKGAGAACNSGQCCGSLVCNLSGPGRGICGPARREPLGPPIPRACVGLGSRCSVTNPCCAGSGRCQADIDGFRCLMR
jgi:hypothetical protein